VVNTDSCTNEESKTSIPVQKRDSSAVLPDRDVEKDNSFELREVSMYSSPKNVTTNN